MNSFRLDPAPWLPAHDRATLDYVRAISREEMEYTNETGFSVQVVVDPLLYVSMDIFHRIYLSDVEDRP